MKPLEIVRKSFFFVVCRYFGSVLEKIAPGPPGNLPSRKIGPSKIVTHPQLEQDSFSLEMVVQKMHKSNHSQMFFKVGALKNFAIVTGKCLCWSLFLINSQVYNFKKKRFQHRSFPVNIAKFLRTFYIKHFRSLLLVTAIDRGYSKK